MRQIWFALAIAFLCNGFASAQSPFARIIPPISAADQRADLLPHPIYDRWVPYRKVYNRPRFVGGAFAAVIEPTSQEAMSWEESHRNCKYCQHAPGTFIAYNFPRAWEVLPIDARPNKPIGNSGAPIAESNNGGTSAEYNDATKPSDKTEIPSPTNAEELMPSPSDLPATTNRGATGNLPSDSLSTPFQLAPDARQQMLEMGF